MILGISLVVNELNKGQRMVFRYPESIPQSIDRTTNKGLIKLYDQYFGFSLENLAKLFRPKNALYNKILEISIDDLNFVSYPCQCQGSSYDEASVHDDNSISGGFGGSLSNALSPVAVAGSQSGEVITMFNLIVTSVSHKAMLKINPAFAYKCQYKFASTPGSDPVAAAIGVNNQCYGLCKQTIKRIVEVVAKSLMQEERTSRYVTEQVALMLRIMDNWYLSKQLDATAGGAVHMESGNSAAMAASAAASCDNPSTPVVSRTNSARPGATTTAAGVATTSLASTPRSSRSSSNAPVPDASTLSSTLPAPASASSNSATLLSAAISNAGGTATGNTTPRASRSNSNAPTVVSDTTSGVPAGGVGSFRSSAANSNSGSVAGTPDLNEAEFQKSIATQHHVAGIAKVLSIDTEFETHSLETSPVPSYITAAATTPGTHLAAITPGATGVASIGANSTGSGASSATNSPIKAGTTGANGALTQFNRAERNDRSNLNSPATLPPNHPDYHTGGLLSAHAAHSRSNSGMPVPPRQGGATPVKPVPTPSAAGGISGGVGSASFGSMGLSSIASGSSMGDVLGSPSSKDRRSTEWGAHLLTDFMAQSDLANELRSLFHCIVGGHSVNVSFNSMKSIQVSLFCKDRLLCDSSHVLKALRPLVGVNPLPTTPRRPLSTSTIGTAGTLNTPNQHATSFHSTPGASMNVSLGGSGSGSGSARMRAGVSPRTAVGNLNSALSGQKGGKNGKDYAKIKGINLNTQTMLKIADTDTIMNILYSLDNTAFGLMGSSSESSNLNLYPELGGSDAHLSAQNVQNVQHHLRLLTSNRLYTVIEAADPTSSFLDLSLALDEPVEELISMANYLKSWGLVEIIPVIYGRSCYKVHSKSPLSRDSRVGRAFEALLLSFELPMSETSPRMQDFDRSNSEHFTPVQDGNFESFHSSEGHGSPKRRSSSMTSNDLEVLVTLREKERDRHGHHHGHHRESHGYAHHNSATLNHSQSSAHLHSAHLHPTSSFGVPGASQAAALPGGPSHHLVSPAISKYRQRRESCQDLGSLKNSRSSEHFLRNMMTSSNSLHGFTTSERGILTLPPAVAAVTSAPAPVQTPAYAVPTAFSGTARNPSPSAATAFGRGETHTIPQPARARGSSFGADSIKPRPNAGGFGAAIASFLHQVANHANDTMGNNASQLKSADDTLFRDVESLKDIPQAAMTARKSREDARLSGDSGQNMVSSSFPPSSMGAMNSTAANKELGFHHHIVSLADVGGVSGVNGLSASPLPGVESMGDLYSTTGSAKSPFGLLEDGVFDEVQVVHNLDVAENIPLQYSLPALLSAFNSARVLSEVIDMWPEAVRDFSVEIVVFLLRWHVIVPVDAYIVNMLHMFDQSAQAEAALAVENERRSPVPSATPTTSATKTPPVPPVSTARVNFAIDMTPSASHGTSPNAYSSSFYRGSSESKASHHEEAYIPLRAQLPSHLTTQELAVMERLFPFIAHHAVSSKTISDIVWVVRIPEEEIIHVVEKIPFLQIVKKIAP